MRRGKGWGQDRGKGLRNTTTVYNMGFLGGSAVKNQPAKQETWVPSLGGEDPLEKEMVTHSSIIACEIPWTEKPGRLWFKGSKELDMTVAPHSSTLAWKIPWVEEPGGLQSMGSLRVRHD